MFLRQMLSDYWFAFQREPFPRLESELGPMGERYELVVAVLELVRVEALLPYSLPGWSLAHSNLPSLSATHRAELPSSDTAPRLP